MAKSIEDLEKEFYVQRDRILKELNKREQSVKKELDKLMAQMAGLKNNQKKLWTMDNTAKKKLQQAQQKMQQMKKQEINDQRTIVFMKNRIKQMKKEIPTLEKNIRRIVPERDKIARSERNLANALKALNKNISKNQATINILKAKMKKLTKKEAFIKGGKIMWGALKPLGVARKSKKPKKKRAVPAKKEPVQQAQKPERKKSIFDIFSS